MVSVPTSAILTAPRSTSISGAAVAWALPLTERLYGFSSASSLAIAMVKLQAPAALAVTDTMKMVVAPMDTVAAGWVVTLTAQLLTGVMVTGVTPVQLRSEEHRLSITHATFTRA